MRRAVAFALPLASTDLFTEQNHGLNSTFVVTRRGLWRIAGGEVLFFGEPNP